ncbi:hypothetical protein ACVXG7_09360 [Enterobacter hormaechei]
MVMVRDIPEFPGGPLRADVHPARSGITGWRWTGVWRNNHAGRRFPFAGL